MGDGAVQAAEGVEGLLRMPRSGLVVRATSTTTSTTSTTAAAGAQVGVLRERRVPANFEGSSAARESALDGVGVGGGGSARPGKIDLRLSDDPSLDEDLRCGVVWCGVVWCGVVWSGVVWCGVVWCGVVWCGVVW